jgi:hypothetical protein
MSCTLTCIWDKHWSLFLLPLSHGHVEELLESFVTVLGQHLTMIKEGNLTMIKEGNPISYLACRSRMQGLIAPWSAAQPMPFWLWPRLVQRYIYRGHRPHTGSNDSYVRHTTPTNPNSKLIILGIATGRSTGTIVFAGRRWPWAPTPNLSPALKSMRRWGGALDFP